MMTYSDDTLAVIRSLAGQGWPPGAVAKMVGWELGRLQRAVSKHMISFKGIQAKSKTPDLTKTDIRWDGEKAWHGKLSVYLPPAEGRLFNAMLRSPDHDWNIDLLAAATDIPRTGVSNQLCLLRVNLECIGLTITRRGYEIVRL